MKKENAILKYNLAMIRVIVDNALIAHNETGEGEIYETCDCETCHILRKIKNYLNY